MEILGELEPMSTLSQYFNTSAMCVSVLGVIELETPITPSEAMLIITDILLPANPSFSSIMVKQKSGERKWKKVVVNPEDHIYNVSNFSDGLSSTKNLNDTYFDEYLTKVATKPFSQNIPLWEIHVFKYPTSNAACTLIFKIHHSIADGFSLMSTILSHLKRADDHSLPLTFPSRQRSKRPNNAKNESVFSHLARFFPSVGSIISNLGWTIMKSTLIEDDPTPIRSEEDCMERIKPIAISTMTFSLDQIKKIKDKLDVTVNDVLTGIILLGIRLYMEEISCESIASNLSALILLNTRKARVYKSVRQMLKPDSDAPWGNHIAFLPIPVPKLMNSTISTTPLQFIKEAQERITMQRKPLSVFIAATMFAMVKHLTGTEIGAMLFKKKMKNSSIMISNMIGPVEKMALANHPVKGLYFTVPGIPQSLLITIVSYMGDLRIVVGAEKSLIDQQKLKSCIEVAFQKTLKVGLEDSARL